MISKVKQFTENAYKDTFLKINIAFIHFKPAIHVYYYPSKKNPRIDKI